MRSCVLQYGGSLDVLILFSPVFAEGGISAITCLVSSQAGWPNSCNTQHDKWDVLMSDWVYSAPALQSGYCYNEQFFSSLNHFFTICSAGTVEGSRSLRFDYDICFMHAWKTGSISSLMLCSYCFTLMICGSWQVFLEWCRFLTGNWCKNFLHQSVPL